MTLKLKVIIVPQKVALVDRKRMMGAERLMKMVKAASLVWALAVEKNEQSNGSVGYNLLSPRSGSTFQN